MGFVFNIYHMKYLRLFEEFKEPVNTIKSRVHYIVANIGYRKGKPFFDALDDAIKQDEEIVLELVKGYENEWIASSGGFGDILYRLYTNKKFTCKGLVIFNGKMLTNNIGVKSWYPRNFDISNKSFVYLDDSYFSGGTVKKIEDFLLTKKSNISEIAVIYDGSENKKDNVYSFYRYWDFRDLEEYKKKKAE